jgi:hypothetical protein
MRISLLSPGVPPRRTIITQTHPAITLRYLLPHVRPIAQIPTIEETRANRNPKGGKTKCKKIEPRARRAPIIIE